MKERPILFSGPMVKAILEDRKTQTRRVVKPQPVPDRNFPKDRMEWNPGKLHYTECNTAWNPLSKAFADYMENGHCPYGEPGDRLWVKETWGLCSHHDPTDWCGGSIRGVSESELREQFLVEHRQNWITHPDSAYWRPSIFMPRWASRITLEITGVRVERLQQISREDAKAEGLWPSPGNGLEMVNGRPYGNAQLAFRALWESINGHGSWDDNPFVWVVEFRRVS